MTKQNSRSQSGDDKKIISNEEIVDSFFNNCKRIQKLSQKLSKREKIFLEICKTALVDLFSEIEENYSPCLCPDQYVGKIGKFDKDFNTRKPVFSNKWNVINIPQGENIMIMILESPHKDEFNKDGKPIGPAVGKTGENIRDYIEAIFKKKIEGFQNYHLILMNPIPFQCSLGVSSGTFRDEVFAKSWEEEEKKFEERLDSLLKALNGKTVVIVNACTQEKVGKKKRKQNVTESIKKVIGTYKSVKELWEAPHPSSSWWFVEKYWKEIPIER